MENPGITQLPVHPAFTANNIPVFFCCDDRYLPHTASAIASVIACSSRENNYDFIVLGDRLRGRRAEMLAAWNPGLPNVRIRVVDIGDLLDRIGRECFPVSGYITIASYYRFFAPEVFSAYNQVLYLDSDVIALADVAELYRMDLRGFWVGAGRDHLFEEFCRRNPSDAAYKRDFLGMAGDAGYFNSGVILFNLEDMRRDRVQQLLLAKLQELGRPRWHDQDVLNSACQGKTAFFDDVWNFQEWMADPSEASRAWLASAESTRELARGRRHRIGILHYTTGIKPWMWNYYGSGAEHYWKAAANTPFHAELVAELQRQRTTPRLLRDYAQVWLQIAKYTLLNPLGNTEKRRQGEMKLRARKLKLSRIRQYLSGTQ